LNNEIDRPNRSIGIGRLLHWKGFHLGLRAFAKANLLDFAAAMIQIADTEDLRLQMGKARRQRVKNYYSWAARGRELAKIYAALMSRSQF
jgi:hypothetical protein